MRWHCLSLSFSLALPAVFLTALATCGDRALEIDGEDGLLDGGDTAGLRVRASADEATAPRCDKRGCGDPAARAILFPGDPACDGGGCERALASADVFVPARHGEPFGDTYQLGTEGPAVLAGYSSGRIALLRRLALVGDGRHAVMLDPAWDDGERDFLGRGPQLGTEIVRAWLQADPRRTFLLVYHRASAGWSPYDALRSSDVGSRVTACEVGEPHLRLPGAPGLRGALLDPARWDNGACRRGPARGFERDPAAGGELVERGGGGGEPRQVRAES